MEETNGISLGSDSDKTFPAVDIDKELNPGRNTNFEVDPVSSHLVATKEIQEQSKAARTQKEREKKDALQALKSAIIVSAITVVVAGAIFAITKKLKEK
ncbi:hypothetical protein Acr_15g0011090 [Actinidia rufa]|uniref:Transmembrane protein n=1 Tax=Actinidia rufa TaxID=165716 RepID=A0A7J0FUZ8_9ERIC|nr:hypothetical protein Acr_15g0011090 [Actinidia rufa]